MQQFILWFESYFDALMDSFKNFVFVSDTYGTHKIYFQYVFHSTMV